MAREFIFGCDGCDTRVSRKSAERPPYWADVDIDVTGYTHWAAGGSKDQQIKRLLCASCQIILRDHADPKKWVRPEKDMGA